MAADRNHLADNVFAFLEETSTQVGKMIGDRFTQDLFCSCLERLESPIEDLFLIAVHAQCLAEDIDLNPDPEFDKTGQLTIGDGINIRPQVQIGTFRVDFLLSQKGMGPDEILRPIVVELDGHAFHDKDKKQRAYEKSRDRFLVKQGFRVLHFTGSEVVADPHRVAYEVLDMLGVFSGSFRKYDPQDPLGTKE